MGEGLVLSLTVKGILLVLYLSLPTILVAAMVGLGVSLFQALTQLQDQTLSFALKLIAVIVVLLLTVRWAGGEIMNYSRSLFDQFPVLVRW